MADRKDKLVPDLNHLAIGVTRKKLACFWVSRRNINRDCLLALRSSRNDLFLGDLAHDIAVNAGSFLGSLNAAFDVLSQADPHFFDVFTRLRVITVCIDVECVARLALCFVKDDLCCEG